VNNNPLRYTDPTGHRIVDGCSELAGGCSVTQRTIDEDKRKENKFRQRTEYLQCWSGDTQHCSGLDKAIIGLDNLDLGDGTIQIGVGMNGFISGLGIRGDLSIALDFKGNIALLGNGGGGGYIGAGGGIGTFLSITNAPSVDYLEGNNVEYGGQVGNAATVAAEVIQFRGKDRERYSGLSIGAQAELLPPWSFEGHTTVTHSSIWGRPVNLPDLIVNIFRP
jgi:hypothetical protein